MTRPDRSIPYEVGRQRICIYGDSLATNLYQGMRLMDHDHIGAANVCRRSRRGSGLVRDDQFDWCRHIARFIRFDRPDIIVVSLGGNDRQNLRARGDRLRPLGLQWWREYGRRVDRVMQHLTDSGARSFWLGIPVVRSKNASADYAKLNAFVRNRAADHKITCIDVWRSFQDDHERYTDFCRSADGAQHRQRHIDGIHFAPEGRKLLAHFVVAAIAGRAGESA